VSPAAPPFGVPAVGNLGGGLQDRPSEHTRTPGGMLLSVLETPAISSGATEQIQNMQLTSRSRSPDPLEVKSDGTAQAGPQNPEGVPADPSLEGSVPNLQRATSQGMSVSGGGGHLSGAEGALELAAMYRQPGAPPDDVSPHHAQFETDDLYGGSSIGLSRMMPTPGLSPPDSDTHLPASEFSKSSVEAPFLLPPEVFKPRSSPPVPLFFADRSLLAPLPKPGTPGPPPNAESRRGGVPFLGNETIASLPTSSVWAIALKGSGEAAARRRAALQPPPEQAVSFQGSAASHPMSLPMQQACVPSRMQTSVPSSPTTIGTAPAMMDVTTLAAIAASEGGLRQTPRVSDRVSDQTPRVSDRVSDDRRSEDEDEMTVMSAGAALESQGLGGLSGSPAQGRKLEHAMSAPAGRNTPTASQASKRTVSKRKSITEEGPSTSEASEKWAGDSNRAPPAGPKRRKQRPAESLAPHQLTSTGRPRPKDRQQIQARLAELRKLIPNTEKLPIDGLLERAIKHLGFLWSVMHERPVRSEFKFPKSASMSDLLDPKPFSLTPVPQKPVSAPPSAVAPKPRAPRPAQSEGSVLTRPKPSEPNPNLPFLQTASPPLHSVLEGIHAPHLMLPEALSDAWSRQHLPAGGSGPLGGLGVLDRLNPRPSSMEQLLGAPFPEPIIVEVLKDPRHMLIEVSLFKFSSFGILDGFLERGNSVWEVDTFLALLSECQLSNREQWEECL
jgi:hypothetical protein